MAKTKIEDISKFLTTTGFILEMEVAESLIKKGYTIQVNQFFQDYDEDKKREIDIIATKKIGEIRLVLIIECKQSLVDDWIFICNDKNPSRYYEYVKHMPKVQNVRTSKVFDDLPSLDDSIPLAKNFIIRDKRGTDKKSTSNQLASSLEKLPKALVDFVYNRGSVYSRSIYVPVTVFNGGMYMAKYNKKLGISDTDWIQYESVFHSENYKYNYEYNRLSRVYTFGAAVKEEKENSEIAETSKGLGYAYLVDIVSEKGLLKLIKNMELKISEIDCSKWDVQIKPEVKDLIPTS